jgi:hypothetical protein
MHLNRRFSRAVWMTVGFGIMSAWSQTVHSPDTAFDVASIKPAGQRREDIPFVRFRDG